MLRAKIPPNHPVRRRLFPEDDPAKNAKNENFFNLLVEDIAKEQKEFEEKWSFDIKNDVPLLGRIKWTKIEGRYDWVGEVINNNEDDEADEEKLNLSKEENTKKETPAKVEIKPPVNIEKQHQPRVEKEPLAKLKNESTPLSKKDEENAPLLKKRKSDVDIDIGTSSKRKLSF